MLRYVLGISILTAGIIILRALTDGKILRKHQYALWLAIPIFMIVSPFLKISIPVDTLFPAKSEAVTVAENESKDKKINEATDLQRPEENIAFKMVRDFAEEKQEALKKVNWPAVLKNTSYIVSAGLIVLLTTYNIGFIVYCRQKRKFISNDPSGKLKIYGISQKETPFLLLKNIYVDGKEEGMNSYIICHETCHHKHGDQWWIVLRYLVLALNWYNPVIWAAFILSGQDCELACDEEVLRTLGENATEGYAKTLFELLKQRSGSNLGFKVSSMMKGEFMGIKKRFVNIKHPAKKSYKVLSVSLAAIMLFTGCVSIQPVAAKLDAGDKSDAVLINLGNDLKETGTAKSIKVLYNVDHTLKYEFLSYDLIDGTEIGKQTKYKSEFFRDGRFPDAELVTEYTDYKAMARDYPEYAEYINSDYDDPKGMTHEEAEKFEQEHRAEYTKTKKLKANFLFVKCRITYLGGGPKVCRLNDFYVFAMRDNEENSREFINCYIELPQNKNSAVSPYDFKYRFNKVGDSVECVIGSRITNENEDMVDDTACYIGLPPSAFESSTGFNYKNMYGGLYFALGDLPKEN